MQIPRLREWREARALTQVELANRAGVSERSVAGYEAGGGARPPTVRRLAEALGVEVLDLMGETAHPKESAPPSSQPTLNGALEELRRAAARREAGEALDKFREQMEKRLAGGELNQAAIEEAGRAASAFVPTLLLALGAEMRELKAMHRGEPEAAVAQSILYPVIERFMALSTEVNRRYRELAETEAQRQEAGRRLEQMRKWTRDIA